MKAIGARGMLLIILCIVLSACNKQSKEELFNQGMQEMNAGNPKGAIVYYLNALELDANFVDARKNLASCYLAIGKLEKSEAELATLVNQAPNDAVIALTLAQIYNRTERTDKAIALAEKTLTREPGQSKALEVLGDSYRNLQDYDKSQDYYRKSLQLNPSGDSAKLGLARTLQASGDMVGAKQALNEVIALAPTQKAAYFGLFNIESKAGNGANALEILNRYLKIAPKDIDALYWSGIQLLNNNAVDQAETVANKLLTDHPDHPGGHQIKGLIYFYRDDYPAAIVELNRQLKYHNDIIGHYFIGLAYGKTNQPELAINHFQKVLDINSGHLQSRLQIASSLIIQKRFDEAMAEIAKVRQIEPDNAFAYYLLGNAYMGSGKFDRAIESLDKAIALNPGLVEAQVKKGLFNLAEGQPENAEAELAKAISAAPLATNNRLILVNVQLRQQKYDAALQTLRGGLSNRPDDAVLYNYMAAAYFGLKKADKAIESLQKAKQASPDFLAPYLNLAQFYFASGNQAKALAEYQALLQKAPANIQGLLGVAVIQEINGEDANAAATYQKANQTGAPEGALALSGYWLRRNDKNKAMEVMEQAYGKHPGDPRILEQRGRLALGLARAETAEQSLLALEKLQAGRGLPLLIEYYLRNGQEERARQLANEAITKQPASAYGYGLLSAVHGHQKRPDQVETTLLTGIARATGNQAPLKLNLADFYIATGKPAKAKAILDELHRQYPNAPEARFALGSYFHRAGDKAQAISHYQAALAANPNHVSALNNLAYLYATSGNNLDEALELAVRAFRTAPGNPALMDTLGFTLVKKGQSDKAVPLLEKAVTVLPQATEVKLHLAQAYLAQGQTSKAGSILRPIADSAASPHAGEARRLLQAAPK